MADAKINMPGEGRSVWLVGDLITVKVSGEETGSAYSLMEDKTPPGGGPPPHVHANEDESFYVLEGEVELLIGERTVRVAAGSSAYLPRGVVHTFKNVGETPSRMLAVVSPGGLEEFFLEAGEAATEGSRPPEGEPDIGRIVEIGRRYGVEFPPPPA